MRLDHRFTAMLFVAALVITPAISLPAQQGERQLPRITDGLIYEGKLVFLGTPSCVTCHGLNGRGTERAPRLSDKKWLHGDGSYAAIIELVTHGVPEDEAVTGQEMPFRGWRNSATDREILAVAAYVWSLSHQ